MASYMPAYYFDRINKKENCGYDTCVKFEINMLKV